MKITRGIMIMASVAMLGACSGFNDFGEVEALNETQSVGSPFTQKLAAEYKNFVNTEIDDMSDHADGLHFSRKGLAAARGDVVMPEPLADWSIRPEHMEELSSARARLVSALDLGARELLPEQSAVAQARFDCWIEQQEENYQQDDINACKVQFVNAVEEIEKTLPEAAPAPSAAQTFGVDPNAPMAVENAMYLVFFDFDQSAITTEAQSVLDSVSSEVAKRKIASLNVVGHADTSGPEKYNENLAMRRAEAVRDALVQRGLRQDLLKVESRGERDLLVKTPDGIREPANRRAQISFE